jgi:hypothetical protein
MSLFASSYLVERTYPSTRSGLGEKEYCSQPARFTLVL